VRRNTWGIKLSGLDNWPSEHTRNLLDDASPATDRSGTGPPCKSRQLAACCGRPRAAGGRLIEHYGGAW
jgi:hypothetical protein